MAAAERGKNITAISYLTWRQVGWVFQPLHPWNLFKVYVSYQKIPDVNVNISFFLSSLKSLILVEGGNPFLPLQECLNHTYLQWYVWWGLTEHVFVHPFILYRPSLSIDTSPQQPLTQFGRLIPYVLFFLIVMPQVFEKFYKLTSFYFSYHVTSEQNISPEPEMVYWQWLTANPDQPYKVFYQTGFCIHIQAAGCLQWDKMSHIFVYFSVETKILNESWKFALSACGLLPQITLSTKVYEK